MTQLRPPKGLLWAMTIAKHPSNDWEDKTKAHVVPKTRILMFRPNPELFVLLPPWSFF